MTKTERNKTINKLVYKFVEKLGYEVDMSEIDVMFISPDGNMSQGRFLYQSHTKQYECNAHNRSPSRLG